MTMPEGAGGLDPGAWMSEWVNQNNLSGLAARDQATVTDHYRGQVQISSAWQAAANAFFQNILSGFGDLGTFLNLVVQSITGTPGALTDLQAFVTDRWNDLADSLSWLTHLGALGDTLFKFLEGSKTQAQLDAAWTQVLTDFNISDPNWSAFWDGALTKWVTPTGMFAPAVWLKRLTQDLTILFDFFHLVYQAGSAGDAPGHLGSNGKPTWYSAWNDLLDLFGVVHSATTPTDPAPTIGQAVTSAQAQTQAVADAVNQGVQPAAATGATAPVVNGAVAQLTQAVSGLQSQVVNLQSTVNGPTTVLRDSGQDSPATASLGPNWTVSGVNVVNRDARYGFIWGGRSSLNTARLEIGIYNTPLATNDQVSTIVINALMDYWPADFYGGTYYQDGAPENWIILRADAPVNPQNYVFARIRYNDVQIGYVQGGGSPVMLGSPTTFKATTSASYSFHAGDASSDYNFKIVSGGSTVATYVDSAHVTSFCVSNLYSGQAWRSDNDPGRSREAAPAATSWSSYDAVVSAGIPPGYGHVNRLSTSTVTLTTGGAPPAGFYNNTIQLGSGLARPTSGPDGFQVSQAGLYTFSWGIRQLTTPSAFAGFPAILVDGSLIELGSEVIYISSGGTLLSGIQLGMSSAGVLLNAGQVVSPGMFGQGGSRSIADNSGSTNWCGDSSGGRAFMKIAKIG